MIDFNIAGLDPAAAQLFTAMNNRPSLDANRLKISNEMRNQEIDDFRLSKLNPNLGVMAPLVAGLQGLAKAQGRRNSQKNLDQLFSQMEQAEAKERMSAQIAAERQAEAKKQAQTDEYSRQLARDAWQSHLRQQEDAANAGMEPPEPAYDFDQESKLRKEFGDSTKGFAGINDSFGRVKASLETPSAAGDLALIFNYMKMLDPGSTVREGEFAQAAASGNYGDRLKAAGESILSGRRLSDSQRADFGQRAFMLYKEALRGYDTRAEQFRTLAEQYEARPDAVIRDRALYRDYQPPSVEPQGMQPGQVEDGYEYMGGNPADPESWRPVQ